MTICDTNILLKAKNPGVDGCVGHHSTHGSSVARGKEVTERDVHSTMSAGGEMCYVETFLVGNVSKFEGISGKLSPNSFFIYIYLAGGLNTFNITRFGIYNHLLNLTKIYFLTIGLKLVSNLY